MRTWGCDVNVRWESDDRTTFGPAPLHTAVRHGAIESVYCLLSYHADLNLVRRKFVLLELLMFECLTDLRSKDGLLLR